MALKAGFATLSAFPLVPAPCQNGPPERESTCISSILPERENTCVSNILPERESTYVSSIPPGKGKHLRFKHPSRKGKTPAFQASSPERESTCISSIPPEREKRRKAISLLFHRETVGSESPEDEAPPVAHRTLRKYSDRKLPYRFLYKAPARSVPDTM